MMERKVYLLLTDTRSLFTRMIKLYTKKPYNHISISFDPQMDDVYSFGRKWARNPFIGGLVKENIETGIFKQASCAIYYVTVSESQFHKMNAHIMKMYEQKSNYRYNLLGVFAVALNKSINRKNAFFCSQFVATVLKECGITDFQKPLSLVTPHDIQEAFHFQLVYQGNLEDYFREAGIQRKRNIATGTTDRIRLLVGKIWSA